MLAVQLLFEQFISFGGGFPCTPPLSSPVDWSSAKILHKETNLIKRKVVEALHISEAKHTINLDQGLRLNPTWQTLTIA